MITSQLSSSPLLIVHSRPPFTVKCPRQQCHRPPSTKAARATVQCPRPQRHLPPPPRHYQIEYEEFKVRINAFVTKAQKVHDGVWNMQDGKPWPGDNVRDHPGMIQVKVVDMAMMERICLAWYMSLGKKGLVLIITKGGCNECTGKREREERRREREGEREGEREKRREEKRREEKREEERGRERERREKKRGRRR
ncbi:hypothetical protein ACS0TY_003749 [Phlomoides rotata]